jgi:hypothetical protein
MAGELQHDSAFATTADPACMKPSTSTSIPPTRKCQDAVLTALRQLSGEAARADIVALAEQIGCFTHDERRAPAPPSHPNYGTYLAYKLSWAITQLRRDGAVVNVSRGRWRVAD